MKFKSITGMRDVVPEEQPYWRTIERKIQKITNLYGFKRVDPPILESTNLFIRGVGDTTDIVEKEMYTFEDKGKNSVTMRPEFTAGVMRLYLQNGLHMLSKPVKIFSMGPVFRYERPQAGRFRQHTQFNVEALGESDPMLDLEVMSVAWQLYSELGFKNISFQLNSTGCPKCRPVYIEKLREHYQQNHGKICDDCKRRLDKNPLRLLDCKVEGCQPVIEAAPVISEHLCKECQDHFSTLKKYLELTGRDYTVNHKLVRGLDYYTKTVFEVWASGIGAQAAMCGGGRYDGLIEQLGGQPTPGIGFGSGIERIIMSMKEQGIEPDADDDFKVFIAHMGEQARLKAVELTFELRENDLAAQVAFGERSFKSQMKEANKSGARFALILGDDEVEKGVVAVKDLIEGDQTEVNFTDLVSFIKDRK